VLLGISAGVWGQDVFTADMLNLDIVIEYINRCYNYLNKPVQSNFIKVGTSKLVEREQHDVYKNQSGDILLHVYNGNVFNARIGLMFELTSSANRFFSLVYDALELTGWEFYNKFKDFDVYIKNTIGVMIFPVQRRSNDKAILVNIWILTEEYFNDFFDYSSNNAMSNIINDCINLLDKPVAGNFQSLDGRSFINNMGIVAIPENGKTILSVFGKPYESRKGATEFNSMFYEYFEDNNWKYYATLENGANVYSKDGVFACVFQPSLRNDGLIGTMVAFTRNFNNFKMK
jgi:hypothetical protein